MKIPFLAAVVLYINETKPDLTDAVLAAVGPQIQSAVVTGAWRDFKLRLRFIACLQVLFEGEGAFPLLDELFERAVDLQTASSEDVWNIIPLSSTIRPRTNLQICPSP